MSVAILEEEISFRVCEMINILYSFHLLIRH